MKLSDVERLLLANQFRILEQLAPDTSEKNDYGQRAEVLERGFTGLYSWVFEYLDTALPEQVCEEVFEILNMHRALRHSFDALDDKSGLDSAEVAFRGFDGNEETEHYCFAEFLRRKYDGGRYGELHKDPDNSHAPVLESYKRMLSVWHNLGSSYALTKDEINSILSARYRC